MIRIDKEAYGRLAYDTYKSNAGGKSLVTGDPLPDYDALPERVQFAWEAAADIVATQAILDNGGE